MRAFSITILSIAFICFVYVPVVHAVLPGANQLDPGLTGVGPLSVNPNTTGGGNSSGGNTTGGGNSSVTGIPNPLNGINSLYDLVQAIINNIVVPIGSVVIVLMIIFAGFQFVTAQGNPTKIEEAKKTFFFAVIGAAILLGSWAIAQIIKTTVEQVTGYLGNPYV